MLIRFHICCYICYLAVALCNQYSCTDHFQEPFKLRKSVLSLVSVELSHTALGNLMSPLRPEEGNRDLWLELQTLTLPLALRHGVTDRHIADIIRK